MKKFARIAALLSAAAVCAGLAACGQGRSTLLGRPGEVASFSYPENTTENFIAIKESAESFADEFTARAVAAYEGGENFVISPISVYSALAMAAECADGSTREEILSALNVDYELLRSDFLTLYRSVLRDTKTAKASFGNSVWVGEGIPVKQTGVDSLAENYGAYSYSAYFAYDNEEANEAVRHFVKEQTNGLIDRDFELSEDTFFTLINTLYLKDNWNKGGDEISLTDESYAFENADGSVTDIQLMRGHYNAVRAHEGETFTSCYTTTHSGYKLMFIVPKDGYRADEVMTTDNLAEAKSADYNGVDDENYIAHNTRCIFPAFSANGDIDAKDILEDMGIEELFDKDRGANLSNMFEDDEIKLYCPEVRHVATLEVDRKGIEGAAVTVLPADGATSAEPYETVYYDFVVDKAFGFVLMNSYGTTLFAGTVNAV